MKEGGQIRKLNVVPFSGSDYSLGNVLLEKDGTASTDPQSISAKLSLLFQWPEYSWIGALIPGKEELRPCKLSYDEDEATPSELHLKFSNTEDLATLSFLKKTKIRFELFRVCYEFETSVLATADPGENDWDLILAVPERLVTYKQRRLPRVRIPEDLARTLPKLSYECANGCEGSPLLVTEMGLSSVVTNDFEVGDQPPTFLVFHLSTPLRIPIETIRRQGRVIFRLLINDNNTFSRYFNIYRTVAYPGLAPGTSISNEDILHLYEGTGYLEGFQTKGAVIGPDLKSELFRTWSDVSDEQLQHTADFVVIDTESRPVGASSVTKAFSDGTNDYWAFHQLCSRKSPDLLSASGHLYTWRAEYLAGRIGSLKGIAWFRSESRWLERIYTKFARQCQGTTMLKAIKLVKGTAIANEQSSEKTGIAISRDKIGNADRTVGAKDGLLSGLGPDRLNVSGLLNHVLSLTGAHGPEELLSLASTLTQASGRTSAEFYISLDTSDSCPNPDWSVTPSDRVCIFSKEDLLDFPTCVEHSIAVTRRKLEE